jgi:hypothetical protein
LLGFESANLMPLSSICGGLVSLSMDRPYGPEVRANIGLV